MKDFSGKKLLLIGSDVSNMSIVETAHDMGIYVIAADGISDPNNAPTKRAADEAWDIDYFDTDGLAEKCAESGVDGVIAGYSEFRVLAACRLAERMGFPFYATEEQIQLTRNKRLFKDACRRYGIPTPRDYCFSYPMTEAEKENISFPVIVKPADYAGRKGITVCLDRESLEAAVEFAGEMSVSKTVIVEDYLDGIEFSSVYTLANGQISLSCVNEKYITDDQKRKSGLCEFLISPASFYDRYIQELDSKIKDFLKGIGATDGVAFFQGMVTPEKIFVFEMGYRVNGNNDFQVVERINGINFLKMLIAHSLTGDMCADLSKDNPRFPCYSCTLLFYAHAGKIAKFAWRELLSNDRISDINP